jgi:hypothetical protein
MGEYRAALAGGEAADGDAWKRAGPCNLALHLPAPDAAYRKGPVIASWGALKSGSIYDRLSTDGCP